ncbi:MAG: hypothetical protein WBA53_06855 [Burkholderiaceae bacterium]
MSKTMTFALAALAAGLAGCAASPSAPPSGPMSFFVTSSGLGKGGDLGGLQGADSHCQKLAQAAGAGNRTWRAYLSTQGTSFTDPTVVNARDRIGSGPWFNAKGVQVAANIEELHSAKNNITKETALTEKGETVAGSGDKPNRHDMLTGSRPDGTAFPPSKPFQDMTCGNWTKSGKEGSAMTGHHDKRGPVPYGWGISWNSAHPTVGCDPESVRSTGGEALFYCFAEK